MYYKGKEFFTSKDLALCVIGGKWKIPIIFHLLQDKVLRLSELQKKLPHVNQRMLIRQLRELEEDQIIERHIYSVVNKKVAYKMKSIGSKIDKVVYEI